MKARLTSQVSRWKIKWKNKKGDNAKPTWIDDSVWAGLVRYWLDPKSEHRSCNSRTTRFYDPEGHKPHKHRSDHTSFKTSVRKIVNIYLSLIFTNLFFNFN